MVVVILVELWFKAVVDKVEYVKYLEDCLTLTRLMSNVNSPSILSRLHFDKHISPEKPLSIKGPPAPEWL